MLFIYFSLLYKLTHVLETRVFLFFIFLIKKINLRDQLRVAGLWRLQQKPRGGLRRVGDLFDQKAICL